MSDLYIYTFDDPEEGREAVSKAMAEAGCYGPKLEKQWAGKSPDKDMIHKFMLWKQKVCTISLTVCRTKGLGEWLAGMIESGDTANAPKPNIRRIDERVNWLNNTELTKLIKKYKVDDLEDIIEKVYEASDSKEDWQEYVDVELDVNLDELRQSEQVETFAIQFKQKKNVDLW